MKIKLSILLLLFSIAISSCFHKGPVKHEGGVVVEKQFKAGMDASGYGINTNGDVSYHTLSEQEKYIVVFKCDHGVVFSINENAVYAKVEKGDTVTIDYCEILSNDNKIIKYDFVDATKKRAE